MVKMVQERLLVNIPMLDGRVRQMDPDWGLLGRTPGIGYSTG